jgi:hypothetical protein
MDEVKKFVEKFYLSSGTSESISSFRETIPLTDAFFVQICGEIYENIHTYVTHGRSHRGTSSMCAFCGKFWPTYSALRWVGVFFF